jgi:high affinity sulfate transporter 1
MGGRGFFLPEHSPSAGSLCTVYRFPILARRFRIGNNGRHFAPEEDAPMPNTEAAEVNPFMLEPPPRGLRRWLPGAVTLQNYRRAWILRDIAAGIVLTTILVPVGMGYAEAAGLPAICGLYATIFPLIAYALFGPSRILVLGPDSALAGIIAATIIPLASGNVDRAVALGGMMSLLAGLLCILAGLVRFGFITDLLSTPVRYGYLNGIALTVLIGQFPKILGFPAGGGNLTGEARRLLQGILGGQANYAAVAIGTACLALILVFRKWMPRVPGILVALVGATVAVFLLDLGTRAGIHLVGPLPQGLPALRIPILPVDEFGTLCAGAVAVALVSFADTSVLSRSLALRGGQQVDPNQELIALGAANVAAGLFQGFSVSSSTSRTPVAESAGAKTQVTGLVGAMCVALLLLLAPSLLRHVPDAALGAIVISACLSLVELPGLVRLYRLRRGEFLLSIVCFLGVALIGVIQGIFLSVALSLLAFIWRAWRPHDAVLGRVDGVKGYHDIARHPEAKRIPGLVLFRWDAPLFFANASIFRHQVLRAVADSPTAVRWVVVAAEPVTDIDITAADALAELNADLDKADIKLCFAEMKGPVKDRLKRYGLFRELGSNYFFPTIGSAVDRYLKVHRQVEWQDWEDRMP